MTNKIISDTSKRDGYSFNDTVMANRLAEIELTAGLLKGKTVGQLLSIRNFEQIGELIDEHTEALIKSAQTELLNSLKKEMPEKKDHWKDKESKDYKFGFNDAIDQFTKLIESKKEQING